MDNFANQRLHVIVDDSDEHENDEDDYIAAPETYASGRVASAVNNHDFQPRTVMMEHRQQNHHYDKQGRFEGTASPRYDNQGHGGASRCNDLRQLRSPPALHREGQMFCCCFASSESVPRCCIDAASCKSNNFGGFSSPSSAKDGALLETELIAFRKAAQMTRTIGAMVIKRQAAMINRQLLQLQQQQGQEEYQVPSKSSGAIHYQSRDNESRSSKRQRADEDGAFRESDSRLNKENRDTKNACDVETCVESTRSFQEATLKAATIQVSPTTSNSSITSDGSNHGSLVNTGASNGNVSTASTTGTRTYAEGNFAGPCPNEAAIRIWYQVDRMKRMSMFLKNAQMAQSLLFEELKDCCCNIQEGENESNDHNDMSEMQEEYRYDTLSHNVGV